MPLSACAGRLTNGLGAFADEVGSGESSLMASLELAVSESLPDAMYSSSRANLDPGDGAAPSMSLVWPPKRHM